MVLRSSLVSSSGAESQKPVIEIREIGECVTLEQLKAAFPGDFDPQGFVLKIGTSLRKKIPRLPGENSLNGEIDQVFEELIQSLNDVLYEWCISEQNNYFREGSSEGEARTIVALNNVKKTVDSLNEQIERIDVLHQVSRLLKTSQEKVAEFEGKILIAADKRQERQGRLQILKDTDPQSSECQQLKDGIAQNDQQIADWEAKISKLRSLITSLGQVNSDNNSSFQTLLSGAGDSNPPPPSIRTTLVELLSDIQRTLEYTVYFPKIAEIQRNEEAAKRLEKERAIQREMIEGRRKEIRQKIGGIALIGAVTAGIFAEVHYTSSKNPESKSEDLADASYDHFAAKSGDEALQKTRSDLYHFLLKKGVSDDQATKIALVDKDRDGLFIGAAQLVRQLDGTSLANKDNVPSAFFVSLTASRDLIELANLIYGSGVRSSLVFDRSFRTYDQFLFQDGKVIERSQFCDGRAGIFVGFDSDPERINGNEIEVAVMSQERGRICREIRSSLLAGLGEKELLRQERGNIPDPYSPPRTLMDAKRIVRDFINIMKKKGFVDRKFDSRKIDSASLVQDLEPILIEAFEGDIYHVEIKENEEGKKMITFALRPEFTAILNTIYGSEGKVGVAHVSHLVFVSKENPPIHSGMGMLLENFCAYEHYDGYRVLVQAEKGGRMTEHNIPLDRYREKFCVSK